MVNIKFILAILLGPALVYASLTTSIEYRFSVEGMKQLRDSLVKAQKRPEEQMELMAYFVLTEGKVEKPIFVGCGPNLPDKAGEGCRINFSESGKTREHFSTRIAKSVSLAAVEKRYAEISKLLLETPPEDAHLNFKSPLCEKPGDHVDYFCQPEGEKGKKVWGCYLGVSEQVN